MIVDVANFHNSWVGWYVRIGASEMEKSIPLNTYDYQILDDECRNSSRVCVLDLLFRPVESTVRTREILSFAPQRVFLDTLSDFGGFLVWCWQR